MLLSAHIFSGITIYAILNIAGIIPNNYLFLFLFMLFSILPDFDIIFSTLHRNLFTHTPFFWACILAFFIAINQSLWIIIFPFSVHLLLDTIDYGVMLFYPFNKKKYGLCLLDNKLVSPHMSQVFFLKGYLKENKMVYAELFLMLLAILSLLRLYYF
jgi:hypothetical protein